MAANKWKAPAKDTCQARAGHMATPGLRVTEKMFELHSVLGRGGERKTGLVSGWKQAIYGIFQKLLAYCVCSLLLYSPELVFFVHLWPLPSGACCGSVSVCPNPL